MTAGSGRDGTEQVVVLSPETRPMRVFVELVRSRELVLQLARRDVRIRYAQTFFGAAWAILQPLSLMGVFALFLGQLVRVPGGELPYPVFVLAGLVPWLFISGTLNNVARSVVSASGLVSKVYFPRIVIPVASALAMTVDLMAATFVLVAIVALSGIALGPELAYILLAHLLATVLALAVGVILATLNVRYRDVEQATPFLVQLWMFSSPVVYPLSLVPERFQGWLEFNPVVAVVELVRWSIVPDTSFPSGALLRGTVVTLAVGVLALVYFARSERSFADVI